MGAGRGHTRCRKGRPVVSTPGRVERGMSHGYFTGGAGRGHPKVRTQGGEGRGVSPWGRAWPCHPKKYPDACANAFISAGQNLKLGPPEGEVDQNLQRYQGGKVQQGGVHPMMRTLGGGSG